MLCILIEGLCSSIVLVGEMSEMHMGEYMCSYVVHMGKYELLSVDHIVEYTCLIYCA